MKTRLSILAILAAAAGCAEVDSWDYSANVTHEVSFPSDIVSASAYCIPFRASLDNQYSAGVGKPVLVHNNAAMTHAAIDNAGSYNYYFVAPYHSNLSFGPIYGTTKIMARLFPLQFPSGDGVDDAYSYKVSDPVMDVKVSDKIDVEAFSEITSRLKVEVSDPGCLLGGKALVSASVSFCGQQDPLSGFFYIDYVEGKPQICGIEQSSRGTELTASYPDSLACQDGNYSIWFSTLPACVEADSVVVTLVTAGNSLMFNAGPLSGVSLKAGETTSVQMSTVSANISQVKESFYQDFTKIGFSVYSLQRDASGTERQWNFSGCTKKAEENGLPGALKLRENSTISLPAVPGKHYTAIRIYAHENTYCSVIQPAKVTSLNKGSEDLVKDFGPYREGIRDGGYLALTGLDNYSAVAVRVNFPDAGNSHQMLITAIEADLADGEVNPSGPGDGVIDYYQSYNDGDTIFFIGSKPVCKSVFGEASLITPELMVYDTVRNLSGIGFINDPDGISVDLAAGSATTKDIGGKGDFILAGRYGGTGKQTNLKIIELRQNSAESWTFFNVKLTGIGTTQYAFARNSSNTNTGELNFIDCVMDYSSMNFTTTNYYFIYQCNSNTGYFSTVRFVNSVVKLVSKDGKNPHLFYNSKTRNLGKESIIIDNSVIYTDKLTSGSIAFLSTGSSVLTNKMCIAIKNSTFANIYNTNSLIRVGSLDSLQVSGNLCYLDYSGVTFATTKFFWSYTGTADNNRYRLEANRFYRMGKGANNVWTPINTESVLVPFSDDNVVVDGNPFVNPDWDRGYIPIDEATLGSTYGATYGTKNFYKK